MHRQKLWSLVSVVAVSFAADTADAGRRKDEPRGSDFYRAAYENNTCAMLTGQFYVPVSVHATSGGSTIKPGAKGLLDVQMVLAKDACDAEYLHVDPIRFLPDETLITTLQIGAVPWAVTVVGEACVAEPEIVMLGDLDSLYFDYFTQLPRLMRLVAESFGSACGAEPASLRVSMKKRAIELDPNRPATRKEVQGKMIVSVEQYAGRYSTGTQLWTDTNPTARATYMANRRDGTGLGALETRRADWNVFIAEHPDEVQAFLGAVIAGAGEALYRDGCIELLYGNTNFESPSPQRVEACRELLGL